MNDTIDHQSSSTFGIIDMQETLMTFNDYSKTASLVQCQPRFVAWVLEYHTHDTDLLIRLFISKQVL
jgi:hypothetical protein